MQYCHDEKMLTAIDRDAKNAFGSYGEMLDEMESAIPGYRQRAELIEMWPILCSYCHGGKKQIEKQFNAQGEMLENFDAVDCVLALNHATSLVAHVTYLFLRDLGDVPLRADLFWARYLFKEPW